MSEHEKRIAKWIHDKLGGDIMKIAESKIPGENRPDFCYKDSFLEVKGTNGSQSSIINHYRGSKAQLENGGILLLDIIRPVRNLNDTIEDVIHYMVRYRCNEIIIKLEDELIAYYVMQKR